MSANIEGITHPLELAASFKSAMSRIASYVALVTTVDESGSPHGLAATTFLSVSMNPASALICVNRSASASPAIPIYMGGRHMRLSGRRRRISPNP